ncbi:uncharacterized protein CEXT_530061 [Caerostris extrusa]|uniref:Uncharacterized protein n=1 Tax=Caerostris extrusa TaxID=172846 RepID=A0AAV4TKJ4_CAEEX|nr:uncharacterized protein CEXT_530061 [Caerostris extrusa]
MPTHLSYKNDQNDLSLFTDLAQHNTNVTFEEYKDNTCVYVSDLTQDFSECYPFMNAVQSNDISIHLKFDEFFCKRPVISLEVNAIGYRNRRKEKRIHREWSYIQTLLRLARSDLKIKITFCGVFASDVLLEKGD